MKKTKKTAFYKRKPLYIVLTVVLTILLCLDLVIGIALPGQMGGAGGMNSTMENTTFSDQSGADFTTEESGSAEDSTDSESESTENSSSEDTTTETGSETSDSSGEAADSSSGEFTAPDSGSTESSEDFDGTAPSTDGEMPEMDGSTEGGEAPSGDGTMPDTDSSTESDTADTSEDSSEESSSEDSTTEITVPQASESESTSSDFEQTSTGSSGGFLQTIKRHWIPIAIVLAILDAASITMLVIISRKEKKQRLAEAKAAAAAAAESGEVVHPVSASKPKKYHKHSAMPWIITAVCMVLLVVVVEGISRFGTTTTVEQTEASILTGEAEISSLSTTLPGAGTLTEEDSEDTTIPEGVEISEWYVSNGDTVTEGDVLAEVDKVSVLSTVESIQTLLDALDEELEEHEEDEISDELTATASGRVKVIYAAEDTTIVDTMYEYSALMLISLDGSMAVSIETTADLSAGDTVIVTLSDGSEEDGKVESYLNGTAIITLTDDGPSYGEEVTVTTEDGTEVGTGNLYIHSELKVTGYSGTVESVEVSVDDEVEAGDTLLTLTDTEYTGDYDTLLEEREALEDQIEELFLLYQDGYIYADCDGVVSGIDEDSVTSTSSTGGGILSLLSNEPEETSEDYLTFLCQITAVDTEAQTLTLSITAEPVEVEDYTDLSSLDLTEEGLAQSLTETTTLTINDTVMVYTYTTTTTTSSSIAGSTTESTEGWVSSYMSELVVGDILLLTCNRTNEEDIPVWIVYAGNPDNETDSSDTAADSGTSDTLAEENTSESTGDASGDTSDSTIDYSSILESLTGDTSTDSSDTTTDYSSILESLTGDSSTDTTGTDETESTETTDEDSTSSSSYAVSDTTILSITPQDTMTITISVDELDILSLEVGQEAQVTLDALPGQSFEGTVTSIDTSGSNSGGSSKYSVEITIDRNDSMLAGMNASVKITLSTTDNVLVIPEAALVEENGTTYVYTSYDEDSDTLGDAVEVTTGLSDGENVEITSGLSEGDTYWYSYLDTVNYSVASASDDSSSFGG